MTNAAETYLCRSEVMKASLRLAMDSLYRKMYEKTKPLVTMRSKPKGLLANCDIKAGQLQLVPIGNLGMYDPSKDKTPLFATSLEIKSKTTTMNLYIQQRTELPDPLLSGKSGSEPFTVPAFSCSPLRVRLRPTSSSRKLVFALLELGTRR